MAALVQTLPQQTTTVMLSGRPSSSSGGFSGSQSHQHNNGRSSSTPRYTYAAAAGNYRGMSGSSSSVAPYAFTSTPQLSNNITRQQTPHLRSENRTSSAPVLPPLQHLQHQQQQGPSLGGGIMSPRQQFNAPSSIQQPYRTLDDNSISTRQAPVNNTGRPKSMFNMPSSTSMASVASSQVHKNSPDRYRRNARRTEIGDGGSNRVHHSSAQPSGSGMAAVGSLYSQHAQSNSSPSPNTYQSYRGTVYNNAAPRQTSVDDMTLNRTQNSELAKRYRRRSLGSLDTAGLNHSEDSQDTSSPHPNAFIQQPVGPRTDSRAWQTQPPQAQIQQQRPVYSHSKAGSSDSISSAKSSRPSSAKNETSSISSYTPSTAPLHLTPIVKQDAKLANAPSRTNDQVRRNPSPLSRPSNMDLEAQKQQIPQVLPPSSTAADHLTAVSKKDEKKSAKSKLRRAFSFGSASELRRASAQNSLEKSAAETSKTNKRNSKYEDEMEPEEAKIARNQEAGGLGESIYSGQGRFFTGSTDNLSVSSTASSASLMLRKMGKGVKKSTRSLVGLFRPKSVVGIPAADGPVNQASAAQVSMVTVEAEREKVNVNLDPHDQPGGGTGFPRLERNSIDAKRSTDSTTLSSDTRSRRSITGGDRERAEVLAAVKKGILKRNDSSQSQTQTQTQTQIPTQSQASPKLKSYDFKTPDFNLPMIPNMSDSPHSSAPSTPRDETLPRSAHRRTDSITVEGTDNDDYFNSMTYAASIDQKGSPLSRNISFSPRIQFHDTWPGTEYDRRGEIATCNRLTPMLAQQIKEELNTFKMEMEVHESSKVYTHFF